MTLLRRFFLSLFLLMLALPSLADTNYVKWNLRLLPEDARAGESAQIVVTVTIEEPWHMYSLTPVPSPGPFTTVLKLTPGGVLEADGNPVQPAPKVVDDPGFSKKLEEYEHAVAFGLPVKIKPGVTGKQKASVEFAYQICKEVCLPPKTVQIPVEFMVAPGEARPDHLTSITKIPEQPAGYDRVETPAPGGNPPEKAPPGPTPPVAGQNAKETSANPPVNGEKPWEGGLIYFLRGAF